MNTETPRTNQAVLQSDGQWSFVLRDCSQELERELTTAHAHIKDISEMYYGLVVDHETLVKQRDEARRLAERYRNLSCDSQEEADETLLPWETTPLPELLGWPLAQLPEHEHEWPQPVPPHPIVHVSRNEIENCPLCQCIAAPKLTEQRDRLAEVVDAATILIAAERRHNTMLAYEGLRDVIQSLNQPTQ